MRLTMNSTRKTYLRSWPVLVNRARTPAGPWGVKRLSLPAANSRATASNC